MELQLCQMASGTMGLFVCSHSYTNGINSKWFDLNEPEALPAAVAYVERCFWVFKSLQIANRKRQKDRSPGFTLISWYEID